MWRRAAVVGVVLAAPSAWLACGGNSVGNSCGAGTMSSNGQCVVEEAGTDSGPQMTMDSSIGSEAATNDTGVPPGNDATTPSDAGADSLLDSAPGDATEDVANWTDDPCLSSTTYDLGANCSTTCGGPTQNCSTATCESGSPSLSITSWQQLPYVMRTPSHPAGDACSASCSTPYLYAMFVLPNITPTSAMPGMIVTVSPPWHIGLAGTGFCPGSSADYCKVFGAMSPDIVIWTTDPNAPSRNVIVSAAMAGQTCPDQ